MESETQQMGWQRGQRTTKKKRGNFITSTRRAPLSLAGTDSGVSRRRGWVLSSPSSFSSSLFLCCCPDRTGGARPRFSALPELLELVPPSSDEAVGSDGRRWLGEPPPELKELVTLLLGLGGEPRYATVSRKAPLPRPVLNRLPAALRPCEGDADPDPGDEPDRRC